MREEEQSGGRPGERAEKPLPQETLGWQQGAGLTWKAAACWPCLQQPSEPLARMLPASCRRQSKYSQPSAWSLKGGKRMPSLVAAQSLLKSQSNLNFTIPPAPLFLTLEVPEVSGLLRGRGTGLTRWALLHRTGGTTEASGYPWVDIQNEGSGYGM